MPLTFYFAEEINGNSENEQITLCSQRPQETDMLDIFFLDLRDPPVRDSVQTCFHCWTRPRARRAERAYGVA